jgi:hypothetical protein
MLNDEDAPFAVWRDERDADDTAKVAWEDENNDRIEQLRIQLNGSGTTAELAGRLAAASQ